MSVSLDKERDAWMNAITADNLTWPNHVSDLQFWNNAAAKIYGVQSIPAAFLIDENGIIVGKDLRGPALEEKLKEIGELKSWKRSEFIEKGGWDKMPGQEKADYAVARACADGLEHLIKK